MVYNSGIEIDDKRQTAGGFPSGWPSGWPSGLYLGYNLSGPNTVQEIILSYGG